MSGSENSVVRELRAEIEEDKRLIRTLRDEIARLRYLLGLHSLNKPASNPPSILGEPSNLDFSS
jgi:hypothetical protein